MAQAKKGDSPKKNLSNNIRKKEEKPVSGSLFQRLDRTLDRNLGWLPWVFMGTALLFSLLLWDPKISLSGDDSFYIIRAHDFIHLFKYPSFQGALYPMVLGLVVAVFGISLTPLKIISLLAMLSSIYLTFRALRNRIPSTLLVATLILVSINSYLLYYASQTYSEAFYIFIQALVITVFFRYFVDEQANSDRKTQIKQHLILAVSLLALTLTRSIGFSAIIAVFGYFLLKGQWKNLLWFMLAFGGVFILFQGLKYAFWHDGGLQFSTQGSGLLNKDYYNPQDGKESMTGLLKRFFDNSHLYLSKHFMYMIGFRTYDATMAIIPLVTLCVYVLALTGLTLVYRKNNYLFFTGLMAGAFLLVTFVVLQAKWDQNRLIIPVLAFLILLLLSALYYITSFRNLKMFQFILPLLVLIAFMQTLAGTVTQVKEARAVSGRYGGLTPDWRHYLQASEWAAANLPKDAVIACRKPSISFVYGNGRNFYGIMQMPNYNAELFLKSWEKNESSFTVYSYADFSGKQIPPAIFSVLKINMLAQFYVGENFYFIVHLPDSIREKTLADVRAIGISGITTPAALRGIVNSEKKNYSIIYPDSLLDNLVKNKVDYVLTANLRRNMLVKNGQIINTVERYMAFIEDKYPGIMSKVTQIGDDENEPAAIMKINYDRVSAMKQFK